MKKKVFSLMMMLLLAFVGVAKAEVVTIGDGTSTTYVTPFNSLWGYSFVEQIFTADEIGTAGTINAISFNMQSTDAQTNQVEVFMKNVSRNSFSSSTDYESVTASDMVFSGTVTFASGWTTITLDTPFEYDGSSNLLIGMHEYTSGYSTRYFYYTSATDKVLSYHSDSANPNPYDLGSYSGNKYTSPNRANIQIDITAGGGGVGDQLHVKYMDGEEEIIDRLNLGVRPAGAWMEPFNFSMYTEGRTYTVNVLDFTPSDGLFTVAGEELPFQVIRDNDVALNMTTNGTQAGVIERQFVAITEGDRAAHIWPVVVELYAPEVPDVWELACEEATSFPFVEVPATAHNTVLHNDYTLPFPEIPEGLDAVYKLTFDQDQILNAAVTYGENGKVALYTEDFYGEGGPMADNNYTGIQMGGGGASGAAFEAMIGDETSTLTSTYFPFHTLWNYSIAENLFLASELTEAGVTTAPMTSLSWYVSSMTTTEAQNGISIWMANVSDAELTTTSHTTAGMTLVYTGDNVLPVAGQWNEFEFNQGNFAWDGHSNVLIACQRLNGDWQGSISWQTHNPGFTAMSYDYDDYEVYDMTNQTYTMYTSATNRANIIFKSNGGRAESNRDIVEIGDGTTTYYYYPVNMYFNYSLTEQIYTAEEIGTAGTINSISFYYDYTSAFSMDNVTLYMKNVTRNEFASTTDMDPMSLSDIVWTGTLSATGPGWITINLDTPFYYDGTSNLLVAGFDGTSGYPGSSYKFRTSPCEGYKGLSWYSDTYTPDPYTATSWSGSTNRTQYRANIQLDITSGGGGGGGDEPVAYEYSAGPVITDLPVRPGTYYLVASSTTPDFEVTINAEDMPCPDVETFALNPTPADDADGIEPGSVTLRWNVPANATGWRLFFGTTYHPEPGHPQTIIYPEDGSFTTDLANSFTVRNLWNNTNYFWRVEFNNDGCPEGVSSPVWGFTTHLNIPQNLTAVDYTVFDDETIVLNWNAVVDRTFRTYNVYRDGELIGSTQTNNIGNATYTDGPLAYNMGGYTYCVTAVYDEGESAPSDPVTVKVSGYGDVNGHVYEQDGTTGIAGATVTMVGVDEFNVNHTYNFMTNAQGYYSGHIYAGSYNGQAAKEGYQTITEPVQGNPIEMVYNQTTSPVDYMLDENFDPVCSVLAEYYPDPEDINAPYVKVSWGCGLPGEEIIEPFETGDFSLFDWQVDPTYPWTITTTNPYEGQYCMKSGGAGVASVVSNMSVTVNIPSDGLMSFFGKISCENSWDYGYFYIDGVQMASFTGAGNWVEKTYDITAGDHTFLWQYTKDASVNSNDDCFYVDYISFYKQPAPPTPPVPGMTYDFEDHTLQGWTSVDADGDGHGWMVGSELMSGVAGHNNSGDFVFSQSYDNTYGVLYPDNYLVSPQVALGGLVRFYACAQDNLYAAEHFGVAVSTTNTNPSSFTMVQEWTMSAKSVGEPGKPVRNSRSGREQGTWYEYTVDLSAYSGNGYVAIRHFNCSDMFYLDVDDITIGEPGAKGFASDTRSLSHYRVYRTNCYNDGPYTEENTVLLATVWVPDTVYVDVNWPEVAPGVYKWGVGTVYEGNRGEMVEGPISWTEPMNVGGTRDDLTYNFDDSSLQGWTTIDGGSPAGYGWHLGSTTLGTGYGHNSSTDLVISQSYDNNYGIVYPDNYLISPQVTLGGSISFWACAQDNLYAAEHFGVAVSTTNNTSPSAFTMLQEWTISAKGTPTAKETVRGNRDQSVWTLYTVDLSAYAGQTGYVAIRHFNCSDQYFLDVDDITISTSGGPVPPTPPTPPTPGQGGTQLVDFEDGEIPANFDNTVSNYPWIIWNNNPYSGSYCMASSNYNVASSESYLDATVEFVADGSIDFYSRISSESVTYDYGIFYIDGVEQYREGGTTNWTNRHFNVSAGTHTFRWYYRKDSSVNSGEDRYFIDEITFEGVPGGGGSGTNLNWLALPRESETIWSNCLDKDMWLNAVTVNVLLNSADSPEGTTVDFINLNEVEQLNYPISQLVLDESGFYAFETFRRGDYAIQIRHEGYEPIDDTVSIWSNMDLRYVMTEILYGVGNVYVSRTGWAMWDEANIPGGGGGGGGQGGNGDSFYEDYDAGMPAGWTTVDADGDGFTWVSSMNPGNYHNAGVNLEGTGHNSSAHYVISGSYANGTGQVLYPDNYLVSPQVNLVNGSTFSFWACAQDASYAAEHFGVAISNNGTSDWTMVNEWTLTAKGNSNVASYGRDGNNRVQGNWYQYTVDLSAYAGQKYIAIRHFNCHDEFILNVDDIQLTAGAKDGGERHLEYYKVMCTSIDGVQIYNHNTVYPFCQLSTNEPYNAPLVEGEHYLCKVAVMYSTGMSAWSEPVEWEYEPCDHWGPVDEVTVGATTQGNLIEWVFEHGYNPYDPGTGPVPPTPGEGDWYYYDNGVNVDAVGLTAGGSFYWGVMFPAGSYTGNMVTKVSMYDYSAHTGNILVYQGGATAPGTLVGQQAYTCTGSNDFVEWTLDNPAVIDPSQNLWIVMNNNNGQYVASACDDTGNPNGRWVSIDGTAWEDIAAAGLPYTWMIRAYVASGAKGEPQVLSYNGKSSNGGTFAVSGNGPRVRTVIENVDFTMVNEGMLEFNIADVANFDGRVYFLYNLVNDSRFTVVNGEENGEFIVSTDDNINLKESFADFVEQTMSSFARMDKYAAADFANQYKGTLPMSFTNSMMMDIYAKSRDNSHCADAYPFCTDEGMYEFPAGVNAGSGETGPDYDCLYTTPNPAWYYMKMSDPGDMDIYMYSTPSVDIDFCCWGPFDDPISPCPNGLTSDKVVSCSYSAQPTEHCMIPASAQTGEYYILVITNYSNQACNINFSKVGGSGSTDCSIIPPTNVDLIGFLITQDGEYLAFAGPDDREYTDLGEFGDHEYCVRPIYPGEMTLPDHNYGWSMGCPVCEFGPSGQGVTCEPGAPIHSELVDANHIKVWWGDAPAPGMSEWLYYDDGVYATSVGAGGTLYWGTMFPAASIAPYAGTNLTKVAIFTSYACSATLNVYVGGAQPGGSPAATQTFTMAGDQEFMEITLNNPVPVDGTQNLWITFYQSGETYPADACNDTGDANNRWVSVDGASWMDLATAGLPGYGWMIRGFVTNEGKGGELVSLPEFRGNVGGELSHTEVVSKPADLSFMNRSEIESYYVYRSTDNANYNLLAEVPAVAGQTYYEYIDSPTEAGTYYYVVTAFYGDCESDPAQAADDPTHFYVSETTTATGMDENGGNVTLFPNPTSGNVTIQAQGMSRITVVSVLGQVVYDTELTADEFILNMGQFNAGMYMVRVYTENGVTVKRVTVMQ